MQHLPTCLVPTRRSNDFTRRCALRRSARSSSKYAPRCLRSRTKVLNIRRRISVNGTPLLQRKRRDTMLARNSKPTRAQQRAQKAIGMGHDDLAHYVSNAELLALLKPYRYTYGYTNGSGTYTNLWLGFGRFTVEEVERVFADPLGRRALIGLLNSYPQIG